MEAGCIDVALASAFGGLLAYAIAGMAGTGGYLGWRWIFVIEGLISVVVGLCCFFTVSDWPDKASFLDTEERQLLKARIFEGASQARMDRLEQKPLNAHLVTGRSGSGKPPFIRPSIQPKPLRFLIIAHR